MNKPKSINDYRALPYSRRMARLEEDGGAVYFVARIEEIPWIEADGETPEEAFLKLDEVFDDALETMIQAGDEIPIPQRWPAVYGYEPKMGKVLGALPFRRKARGVKVSRIEDLPPFAEVERGELIKIG